MWMRMGRPCASDTEISLMTSLVRRQKATPRERTADLISIKSMTVSQTVSTTGHFPSHWVDWVYLTTLALLQREERMQTRLEGS